MWQLSIPRMWCSIFLYVKISSLNNLKKNGIVLTFWIFFRIGYILFADFIISKQFLIFAYSYLHLIFDIL